MKTLMIMLCVMLLCGCYHGREPNDIAYILAMGFDKGENESYKITVQYAKPREISGGASAEGGQGGSTIGNIVVEAPTFFEGVNTANQILSKEFSLAHAKVFVFSNEIASEGIAELMQVMARSEEIRPDVYLAVSRCPAEEFLSQVKPSMEVNPAKYYQLIFESNDTIPATSAVEFYSYHSSAERDCALPLAGVSGGGEESGGKERSQTESEPAEGDSENPAQKEAAVNEGTYQHGVRNYLAGETAVKNTNKAEIVGSAVFRGDRLCGELGSIETELLNMICGDFHESYAVFDVDGQNVGVRLMEGKRPRIEVDTAGETPRIKVKISLKGDFTSLPNGYIGEEDIPRFEETAEEAIEEGLSSLFWRLSRELGADAAGFGTAAKRNFKDWQSFYDYGWEEKFRQAEFSAEVSVKVSHTGLTMKNG